MKKIIILAACAAALFSSCTTAVKLSTQPCAGDSLIICVAGERDTVYNCDTTHRQLKRFIFRKVKEYAN